MRSFRAMKMGEGMLFSEAPEGFQNPELFIGLMDPLGAFFDEFSSPETVQIEVHRDEPAVIGLIIGACLFKAFDLRRMPLDEFLRRVLSVYAGQEMYRLAELSSARHLTAGVEAEAPVPVGYRVETWSDHLSDVFVPSRSYSQRTWLLFVALFLERLLGDRFNRALAAARRANKSEAGCSSLEQRFDIPEDLAAGLLSLPEWLASGGAALVERCKRRLEPAHR